MKNLVQCGNRLPYTNPTSTTIPGGSVVVLQSGSVDGEIGIAVTDIPGFGNGSVCVGGYPEGVFNLPKASAAVFGAMDKGYWDTANANLNLAANITAPIYAGRIDLAGGANGATTANILINRR